MDASGKRAWQGPPGGNSSKRSAPAYDEDDIAEELVGDEEDEVLGAEETDISLDLGEAGRNWERPEPPRLIPAAQSLGTACPPASWGFGWVIAQPGCSALHDWRAQHTDRRHGAAFQQFEVDYFMSQPKQSLYRTDLSEVPVLRMYGVTPEGRDLELVIRMMAM